MAPDGAPAPDLPRVVGAPPAHVVTAVPLEPPARILRTDPAVSPPRGERLRGVDAEIVRASVVSVSAQLGAREPAGGELLAAVRHVLSSEHAEPQHLLRCQLGRERRREVPAGRLRAKVHVTLLHRVGDDHPSSHPASRDPCASCVAPSPEPGSTKARRTIRCRRANNRESRSLTSGWARRCARGPPGTVYSTRSSVQAPLDADRDDAMTVSPNPEGPLDLLVAELSPVDIAVVARFPPHPQRSDAEGEGDARAVAQPLLLPLNPHPPSQRRQIRQRVPPLVPSKHVTGPTGHD